MSFFVDYASMLQASSEDSIKAFARSRKQEYD